MIEKLLNMTENELIDDVLKISDKDTFDLLENTISHNYGVYKGFVPVSSEGPWLIDGNGKKVLDGVAAYSAANLGHNNPFVRNVIKEFLDRKSPTVLGRFLASKPLAYAGEVLKEVTGFEAFLPANGGVEAPEAAIKLARLHHFKKKGISDPIIIYFTGCFHGRTVTVTQFFEEEVCRDGFGPFPAGFHKIPFNDIDSLSKVLNRETAAVLIEPLQGEGGINMADKEYFQALRKLCDDTDTLLIFDEVQTGWGRTGKMFAWEHFETRPDILCTGKSISAGFAPVSGIFADKKLMDIFTPGSHGSTFGGAPLSMMIAIASVVEIIRQKLPERSAELGAKALEKLQKLAERSKVIKEVRGMGLMIGIEIEQGGKTGHDYCEELLEEGMIVKETHDWVIRFSPPVICTEDDIDFAIKAFEKVLG
ncbi:MAG: aspartate aminotransferase family protein [bacterium]|nr:aspartate aminotransferase family protein [bacterium]